MESTVNLTDSAITIPESTDGGEQKEKKTEDPKKEKTEDSKKEKTSFLEKLKNIKDSITVEPVLGCYIIPSVLSSMAIQNLALELACRVNLHLDDETCTKLVSNMHGAGNSTEEQEVQRKVASMVIWKTPLQNIAPIFIILFLGSYSDRFRRRKPFFMFPLLGDALTHFFFLLCSINRDTWPMEAVGMAEAMFPALTGGTTTMIMAIYSYIADVTTVENRTMRIGVVHISASVLVACSFSLSGILYKTIGYYGLFSLSVVIYLVGFVYAWLRLKEPKPPLPAKKNICQDFFDPAHIVNTFGILFRKREGNKRMRIILFMLVFIVIVGPPHGEHEMVYLFTRTRFGWDAVRFSLYITYDFIIHLIGSAIAISVFSNMLKIDDLILATFACTSKVAASFFYAFSETPTLFYCAPLVSIFSAAGIIAMRSIATKLVSPDELGKIQSLFGICETTAPVIYRPIYSQVYIHTMTTLPGAFFLLGALLVSPAIFIFLGIYFLQRKEENEKKEVKQIEVYTVTDSKDL